MLPNLVIIGAAKSATTSLHRYLDFHPDIHMARGKELDFFIEEKNWVKGRQWYEAQFDSKAKIRGESSPNYTVRPCWKGVVERMHSLIPEAKLIYLVRDPVDRAVSHYMQARLGGYEDRDIEEAFAHTEDNHYVRTSKYCYQLEQYLPLYPMERILVVSSTDLRTKRPETLRAIYSFLGVDVDFQHPDLRVEHHKASDKVIPNWLGKKLLADVFPLKQIRLHILPALPKSIKRLYHPLVGTKAQRPDLGEDARKRVAESLKQDVECFRKLTGQDFADWCL